MNFIVGLGNPGNVYAGTRHNVGFLFIDELNNALGGKDFVLKKKLNALVSKVGDNVLIKPQTFMNGSGFSVRAVLEFYKQKNTSYENLYVVHDDLDLDLGELKFQYGKGPRGHNGLLSIYQHLGTKNFWHIRVGIDTRQGDRRVHSPIYVLQRFDSREQEKLNAVKRKVVNKLQLMIKKE